MHSEELAAGIMRIVRTTPNRDAARKCVKQHIDFNLGEFSFPKFNGKLREIYEKVLENPGYTLTELSKTLRINMAQVSYYCRALEDLGVLYHKSGGGMSKRIFVMGTVSILEKS